MDKVSSLYDQTNQAIAGVEDYLDGNDQKELLMAKLEKLQLVLFDALDQLEEMGGFGAFDEELSKTIKFGLQRIEFLIMETWVYDKGPKGRCNFNSLLMCVFGVGFDKNKNYLKKLAKEALSLLPSFANPESQGRSLVKEVDMVMFERQMIAKEEIATHLLQSSSLEDPNASTTRVSVVPVLGKGGAGKTSVTRLVLKDHRVRQHFDIKLSVNISGLLSSSDILTEVARKYDFYIDPSIMHEYLRTLLEDKKYLLILENLFEDASDWFELLEPLMSVSPNCKHGSKILVTTRSTSLEPHAPLGPVPKAIGAPHLLEPLDHHDSLSLFSSLAFGEIAEGDRDPYLIAVGVKICNKCANNLHAIKIIASLLSSQPTDLNSWLHFNDVLLASLEKPVESIQSIVDLMQVRYQWQWGPKFLTYTSLFPSDYKFLKPDLLPLWELQGSVGLDTEEESNEFINKLLLNGYFFEDRVTDKNGEVIYYKVNPLLHEVMKYLTKEEWCLLDNPTKMVDAVMVQHVSFIIDSSWEVPSWLPCAKQLHSLFFFPTKSFKFINIPNISEILLNLKALHALDLVMVHFNSCPDFLGELKQLRYLRLGISLDYFPECITNLESLQTLDLRHTAIRTLPASFHKLKYIRFLYTGCRLIDLPPSFGEITQLKTLDEFTIGQNNGLDALAKLTYLTGSLRIRYQEGRERHTLPVNTNMLVGRDFQDLSFTWSCSNGKLDEDIHQERDALEIEFLLPPSTLERLSVKGWKGLRFPQWAMNQFSDLLRKLVCLQISECTRCQYLPCFSTLPSLRSLQLWGLQALEWVEFPNNNNATASGTTYFPSLRYLMLANLPQLKGWSKVDDHDVIQQQIFPTLFELRVSDCPKMMSTMPLVPSLETLEVVNIHEKLLKHLLNDLDSPTSSTLKELHIKSVHALDSLSITISSLQVLSIRECRELINMSIESSNSIKQLKIQACLRLKDASRAWPNLSVLEELEIESCGELEWAEMVNGGGSARAAWQGFKCLRSLTLTNISKAEPLLEGIGYLQTLKELSLGWLHSMTVLPASIGHLTQLTRLVLQNCPKVKRIPDYLPSLKSLNLLHIKECSKLEKRCKQPDGEDCHLIQHIVPGVYLGELPKQESH